MNPRRPIHAQRARVVPEPTTRSGREVYRPPDLVDVPPELQFAELPPWIGDVVGRRVVSRRGVASSTRKQLGTSATIITRPGTESVVMPLPDQPDVYVVAFMPQGTQYGAVPLTIPGLVLAAVNSILKLVPHKGDLEKKAANAAKDVEAAGYGCGSPSYGCAGRRCSCGR